ncbi:putative protein kinase RLK-Pelle-DLSV family [Medicago truncatula]|uniref:Receptor-like serine/threonine-protein kinase n=1 Tax=Medicago truncatula TaxID=3880 RepID=A0A072UN82_MEDTR|nr:G-type lectin S-receptor-like serine/threonine-protein kinase At1g11410 [Medicago truncatula]KEH31162.1 G-type lectin S-receptor-like Serine/Threonine-kinase [Medicago truncatula]RHN62562.1 putative protein kinase RLK-Pelle-DLSV family [Medicago truncatula]
MKEVPLLLLLLILYYPSCHSLDTITLNQSLEDNDVLVSNPRGTFALGFFTLQKDSKTRYLGIWYNKISEQTIVWVANRDTPLYNTSGVVSISNGNLVLNNNHLNNNKNLKPIWSSNVSVSPSFGNVSAKLLDNGNFVLTHNNGKNIVWQSFDYPTNTLLPFMKLGLDRKTGLNRFLTSWKSPNDPGTGNLTYRIDPTGFPQLFLYSNNKVPVWRTGSWTGQRWSGVPEMTPTFIFNVSFVNNVDEVFIEYGVKDPRVISRMVLEDSGHVRRLTWQPNENRWFQIWFGPKEECDNFKQCGLNSNCDPYNAEKFECECLPGFEPKFEREWYLRDGSGGCVRKSNVSTCRNGEGFVKVARVKVPNTSMTRVNESLGLKECREMCLGDCSCVAFTSENEMLQSGCVTWHGDLEDTRTYTQVGQDLYVRVDKHELAMYAKHPYGSLGKKGMVALLVVGTCLILFMGTILVYWFVKARKKWSRRDRKFSFRLSFGGSDQQEFDSANNSNLPFYDLSSVAAATDSFSIVNKLGEGGFGSVYKGILSNGMEIAVKRLSKHSGQGIEEFKNEVVLISKLQHRNLVRILGCCVQGEEKMLIYEYLPNKSLDFFIFDKSKSSELDWRKRFDIICGVARGILYLHHDSRLRIIHRDLKASNVLLDTALNPKIADFGMARMFGGDQVEAITNRVVGTYGYMSPEYAMEGQFSVKSDVYSFGVLLLEIITGKKNSGQYADDASTNLVGHIWDLWREDKAMGIVDQSLGESFSELEVQRCIQIGLLCVQDFAVDRPSMSAVVSMLGSDSTLPTPKQPAFIFKRSNYETSNPSTSEGTYSVNDASMTMVEAR